MERLQSNAPLNFELQNNLGSMAFPAEGETLLKTLYGELEVKMKPLRFRADVTKATRETAKEAKEYQIRLKKLNAFGLKEVTDRLTMSLLAAMGYHTGQNGLSVQLRRRILDRIYFNNFPKGTKRELITQWQEFKPEERLRFMAETLTYLCLSREHQIDPDALRSVKDLKQDLAYLRKMYYYPSYTYAWPTAASGVDALITNTVMVKSRENTRVNSVLGAVYLLTRKVFFLA
ncbi:hypothetical protein [Robertkochia flava]|uniref:hypothetical protein n=1 Tax=Robertkochia flava TaxID=3447986 RepID=UPI001CCE6BE0|nr:hypothetical protein [Robertkochia marina]